MELVFLALRFVISPHVDFLERYPDKNGYFPVPFSLLWCSITPGSTNSTIKKSALVIFVGMVFYVATV